MKPYVLFLFVPYFFIMQGAMCLAQDARDHQAKSFDLNTIQVLDLKTAKKIEAEKALQDIRLRVSSEVRASVAKLNSAQKQLILQRSNAYLVRQNRDLAAQEYSAGLVSLVRLNEAQRDLISAQKRLALALVSLRQAWHNLETDTGRILISFED